MKNFNCLIEIFSFDQVNVINVGQVGCSQNQLESENQIKMMYHLAVSIVQFLEIESEGHKIWDNRRRCC